MLLLTEVEEESPEGIVCVGVIPSDHPMAHDGVAPAILGIELAAQAAGAHHALRRRADSAAPARSASGFLVAVREGRFLAHSLPAGQPLTTRVRLVGVAGPLAVYTGTVSRPGREEHEISCRFSIYATDEP
jgi:predicted hotdog family 3-hydroxylacyl-ACP dehydratase